MHPGGCDSLIGGHHMPKSIKVPATIEEVVAKLEGTEALLTATEWERTILIRAATKEGRGGRELHQM